VVAVVVVPGVTSSPLRPPRDVFLLSKCNLAQEIPDKSDDENEVEAPLDQEQRVAAHYLASNGYTVGARTKNCLITRTAVLVGRDQSTIHRWLKKGNFLQEIEQLQARYDALSSDGLAVLMRGIPEAGVMPNATACIWWKKIRNPETFDDQFIRDVAKREFEQMKQKLEQEFDERMLRLKAELGLPEALDLPRPQFLYTESPPGELPAHLANKTKAKH
jgi:hypothetical protein